MTVGPDHLSNGARAVVLHRRVTRPPRFLGDPCVRAPLFDPGGPSTPGLCRANDAAFRSEYDVGSARLLSRLYHAARTLPVYASQPGSLPDHATLGTGWWPTFTGPGLSPDWVTQRSFSYVAFLLHTIPSLQASPGADSAESFRDTDIETLNREQDLDIDANTCVFPRNGARMNHALAVEQLLHRDGALYLDPETGHYPAHFPPARE